MKGLKLYITRFLFKHIHHKLEVVRVGDIASHYGEVVSVQQQLPEQLQALTSGHVVLGIQQPLIVTEHLIVVCF